VFELDEDLKNCLEVFLSVSPPLSSLTINRAWDDSESDLDESSI